MEDGSVAASARRPDLEVQTGQTLRWLRLARNWSQEEVALRMAAYGYDFHQTTIAKIEASQRPLRVRELADFAALYGVEVQDLVYPPTASLSETDQEIAEVTTRRDMAQAQADEARATMHHAQAAYQASANQAAALEGRLASLLAVREKLVSWESDENPSIGEGKDQTEGGVLGPKGTSIASTGTGPTVLRMLLGAQLRRLREAKQITREDAGEVIGVSRSKMSRFELGRIGLRDRQLTDLLTVYGVTDEAEREALRSLARKANAPGWWHDYSDILPSWFESYVSLEEVASQIRTYEVQFVPGLLQTEDYARAVMLLNHDTASAREIDRRVGVRIARQALLDQPDPPILSAVIDEAVLLRPLGSSGVMQGQLKHLAEMAQRPNVTIQVVPFHAGGYPATGGAFTILRFAEPDLPDVVYLEQLTSALFLDELKTVSGYLEVIERLTTEALTPSGTMQLLRQLLKQF